jgi:RNA polymerase sigma factor (sigma-70 family)
MDESQLIDIVQWAAENLPRIHRWARFWEWNPDEAEQIGQDSVAKILHYGAGKKVLYPASYAARIVQRTAYDHRARKANSPELVPLDAEHEQVSDGMSIERTHGLRSIMRSVISQLPRRQKQVIWLRYYEGRLWGDVASELGISEGVAKKYHGKAVSNLRKGLNAMGITKEDWRSHLAP